MSKMVLANLTLPALMLLGMQDLAFGITIESPGSGAKLSYKVNIVAYGSGARPGGTVVLKVLDENMNLIQQGSATATSGGGWNITLNPPGGNGGTWPNPTNPPTRYILQVTDISSNNHEQIFIYFVDP